MRAARVRLTAIVFALALLAVAVGAAWLASRTQLRRPPPSEPSAPQRSGQELFELNCADCHQRDELSPSLSGPDSAARALELLEFLEGHGDCGASEDRAIVRFLASPAR